MILKLICNVRSISMAPCPHGKIEGASEIEREGRFLNFYFNFFNNLKIKNL